MCLLIIVLTKCRVKHFFYITNFAPKLNEYKFDGLAREMIGWNIDGVMIIDTGKRNDNSEMNVVARHKLSQ